MQRIQHAVQEYAWGSPHAIPELLGTRPTGRPQAEAWFGAHAGAPSRTEDDRPLTGVVAEDPERVLGVDVVARFGPALPYLLKVIAAERPLSLQVHPHVARAREAFEAEEAAGVPRDAPHRNYRDRNHKPELVYALTPFEAVSGFRAPRRAAELLVTLDAPLASALHALLIAQPSADGIRAAFTRLLDPATRPGPDAVAEVAAAAERRLATGSPSPRADRTVVQLQTEHPGDPGVVTSLLLNPVTLQPGEAMFVPAGGVHAYLHGVGVEIMANSDNVLRAGLTPKHVDVEELLRNVDYVAAPPIRIAPEIFHGATKVFYAPVDDFELSVTEIDDEYLHPLPGRGPRILLCLDGELEISTAHGEMLTLTRGRSAFVPAGDGPLRVQGHGRVVQADVP
ncbi:mannose-6-phosphate isomerase, class I [Cellulomonas shaoxiangyii]|uniref:mannose-6-phosphate isomerase n=1 Tax=Cellulomonas shaoxiangyii TaxID=2566013 RepID=A0A4P7SG36_9CELL|nr:mannose-6-phosphate isomerase, class I [Cellulomonas shaoxiangyii]QCB93149.1 mannose-6-phosphate isomerase, class I [Cellulomonas shaoxiangyii]TGY84808.1 mannose-6-phosphate isomerase, class I [Cellulomonas shaoxiangyii]